MIYDYSDLEQKIKTLIQIGVKNILIKGEAGLGKTTIASKALKNLGREAQVVNLNSQTDISDLLGKYVLINGNTKWVDGSITRALKEKKDLILQELNAAEPEILIHLHSLWDDCRELHLYMKEGNEKIRARNTITIVTLNEGYAGTSFLNRALLDRFAQIEVPFPSEDDWKEILRLNTDLNEAQIDLFSKVFSKINSEKDEDFISIRQGIMFSKIYPKDKELAIEALALSKNMKSELRDALRILE